MSMFNRIRDYKNEVLNKACAEFNILDSLPRLVKVHLLAEARNVSTCGEVVAKLPTPRCAMDLKEAEIKLYESFTLYQVYQMSGWTTALSGMPPISVDSCKQFLLNSSVISLNHSRAYKLSKPFRMMDFVHSVQFNGGKDRFCFLKCFVNPSQSSNRDEVKLCFAVLDCESGVPFGGRCVCAAG